MKIGIISLLLICIVALSLPAGASKAEQENFCLMPIFNDLTSIALDDKGRATIQHEIDRLRAQIGENHGRFKVGFSLVYNSQNSQRLIELCKLAKQNNISLGVILACQTHSNPAASKVAESDFRLFQWRMNGSTWRGGSNQARTGQSDTSLEQKLYPTRDYEVVTPSRNAPARLRNIFLDEAKAFGKSVAEAEAKYPGTVVFINGCIEEELANGGEHDDGLLADYSPFAIQEFRDWLQHRGIYDDLTGAYHGQGAPESITGPFINIAGVNTSPFHNAASPNSKTEGGGPSFNDRFETDFTTWELKYWDPEKFPEPIMDPGFNPTPERATGHTKGGFDAPRRHNPQSRFWNAWSWESTDHGGNYPPGYPRKPAYGFRQNLVRNFVGDLLVAVHDCHVPMKILYPHQIPGELVNPSRCLSGADPCWTGLLWFNQRLGITRFGKLDISKLTPLTRDWGIFEWHPLPNARPDAASLYAIVKSELTRFIQNGCHVVAIGWWQQEGKIDKTFPLNDSMAARAAHDWLKEQCLDSI